MRISTSCLLLFSSAPKKKNLQLTLPSLIFSSLRLAARSKRVEALEQSRHIIESLENIAPETALRFYLDSARTAQVVGDNAQEHTLSYIDRALVRKLLPAQEITTPLSSLTCTLKLWKLTFLTRLERCCCFFLVQTVLDEKITNSRAQLKALVLVISTLYRMAPDLSTSVYERLAAATVFSSSQLLTRGDQCTALCDCTNLFWHEGGRTSPPLYAFSVSFFTTQYLPTRTYFLLWCV